MLVVLEKHPELATPARTAFAAMQVRDCPHPLRNPNSMSRAPSCVPHLRKNVKMKQKNPEKCKILNLYSLFRLL
jgi:hypothetical protein